METILAGESWNVGWLLPAGAALIALGLTAIGAALWQIVLRRPAAKPAGGNLDLQDAMVPPAPQTSSATPMEDLQVLREVDARIVELERVFEQVAMRSREGSKKQRRPRVGLRFVAGEKPATSSETRALAALVARGDDVRPIGRQRPRIQKATT